MARWFCWLPIFWRQPRLSLLRLVGFLGRIGVGLLRSILPIFYDCSVALFDCFHPVNVGFYFGCGGASGSEDVLCGVWGVGGVVSCCVFCCVGCGSASAEDAFAVAHPIFYLCQGFFVVVHSW